MPRLPATPYLNPRLGARVATEPGGDERGGRRALRSRARGAEAARARLHERRDRERSLLSVRTVESRRSHVQHKTGRRRARNSSRTHGGMVSSIRRPWKEGAVGGYLRRCRQPGRASPRVVTGCRRWPLRMASERADAMLLAVRAPAPVPVAGTLRSVNGFVFHQIACPGGERGGRVRRAGAPRFLLQPAGPRRGARDAHLVGVPGGRSRLQAEEAAGAAVPRLRDAAASARDVPRGGAPEPPAGPRRLSRRTRDCGGR